MEKVKIEQSLKETEELDLAARGAGAVDTGEVACKFTCAAPTFWTVPRVLYFASIWNITDF